MKPKIPHIITKGKWIISRRFGDYYQHREYCVWIGRKNGRSLHIQLNTPKR